jgi:LysR family transcriptional activator of nhaA
MLLNYNHLRYFWVVAHEGNLTRAAEKLHIAQSALSIQIKTLETQINQELFERKGKHLILTEAGRLALDYADEIFKTGNELVDSLQKGTKSKKQLIKVGVITTLSRNFQMQFLRPLLNNHEVQLHIVSANLNTLLKMLDNHEVDVVLANNPPYAEQCPNWVSYLIADQPVSLVARSRQKKYPKDLKKLLKNEIINLPSHKSSIRHHFDSLLVQLNVEAKIAVEVDDMAMLRLIALEKQGITLVPPIVVKDELKSKKLIEIMTIPNIHESFYAIIPKRKFENQIFKICIENLCLRIR